jgi:hypothetical protein
MNKCFIGTSENKIQEITLKDKLIDEYAPVDLKKKLLEKKYSLDEIVEMCTIHEQINNQSKAMGQPELESTSVSVNQVYEKS